MLFRSHLGVHYRSHCVPGERAGGRYSDAHVREREAGAQSLWNMIRSQAVSVTVGQRYPLEDADTAHRDLEGRKTTGSTLLLP